MGMDEIKARVTIEDGASQPATDAAQAVGDLGRSLDATASKVSAAADRLRLQQQELAATRASLRELIASEEQYRALPEDQQNTPEALAAWQARQSQIHQLALQLNAANKIEAQTAQVIRDAAPEQQQAEKRVESRSGKLGNLRQRLIELELEEKRHQDRLAEGEEIDAKAQRRSAIRIEQIERLGRVLGNQAAAERAASDRIRNSGASVSPQETVEKTNVALDEQMTLSQRVAGGIEAMAVKWASVTAVVSAVAGGLRAVTQEALSAAEAIQRQANAVTGIARNVGGKDAIRANENAKLAAQEAQLSPEELTKLLEAFQATTDVRSVAPQDQLDTLRRLAKFQVATGAGGAEAARLIETTRSTFNLGDDRAANVAAALVNNGLDPTTARQLVSRAGNAGGLEFVGTLVGARETGLDLADNGRSIVSLVDALTRRDERGRLDRGLRRAGLNDQMSLNERLQALIAAQQSGRISKGFFETLLGGADQAKVIGPLTRAFESGAAQRGVEALQETDVMDRSIDEQALIPSIRFQRRLNDERLRQEINRQGSRNAAFAISQARLQAAEADSTYMQVVGGIPIVGDATRTGLSYLESLPIERRMKREEAATNNTTINIGTVYTNGSNDPLRVVRPPEAQR